MLIFGIIIARNSTHALFPGSQEDISELDGQNLMKDHDQQSKNLTVLAGLAALLLLAGAVPAHGAE